MIARRLLAALAALSVLASAGIAVADAGLARDPDDTPGRLDVRQIRHGHGHRMGLIRHRVAMQGEWGTRLLRRKGAGEIYLLFSTRGNDCAEQRVRIVKREGKLRAAIQAFDPVGCGPNDDSGGQSNFVRLRADIDRRRGRDIIVTFDADRLKKDLDDYTWSVMTTLESRRCNDSCIDYAPDEAEGVRGVLLHDLR
jgi:hypothetical protein